MHKWYNSVMKKTTLCYIKNNGCWLMLYRNKKENDPNEGKWLGIGGRIEDGESPDECNHREVFEETGLRLNSFSFHGILKFRATTYEDEDMYLYSSSDFVPADEDAAAIFKETGEYALPACDEGTLRWVPEEEMLELPMWEGDRVFISKLFQGADSISMTLQYTGEHCKITED